MTPQVIAWAVRASSAGPVAYVEAEYFGGRGSQSALVWDRGEVVLGPLHGDIGTINRALRFLGVAARPGLDEFDTIGLGHHRFTEGWIPS